MIAINLYQAQPGAPLVHAPGQACDQCRRRKTRCDRGSSCAHCLRLGTCCTYAETPKRRGPRPRGRREGLSARKAGEKGQMSSSPLHCNQSVEESQDVTLTGEDSVLKELLSDEQDSFFNLDQIPGDMNHPAELLPPSDLFASPDSLDFALWNGDSSPASERFVADLQTGPLPFQQILGNAISSTSPVCVEQQPVFTTDGLWHGLPTDAKDSRHLIPRRVFYPYVDLFFGRLYPIFPVIERHFLTDILEDGSPLSDNYYALLTSLSAAVIVQLNLCSPSTPGLECSVAVSTPSADLFVEQCLQTRREKMDFVEDADEWTVLTSFFLFSYYGNKDRSKSAWYYLREAIGFAQTMGLDDPDLYEGLDIETQQRRRQIFWLLFVTERAYALQHRRSVTLRPTIELPRVFESSNPKLIYGFVALTKLFKSVDNNFITAWRKQTPLLRDDSTPTEEETEQALTLVNQDRLTEALSLSEIDETQRLDVLVTQQWLRVLVCQLHAQVLTLAPNHDASIRPKELIMDVSRNLLQIIATASQTSLESHGIGMEQKVADVANSLCDSAFVDGGKSDSLGAAPDLLHSFMTFLSGFRNHESQYLPPLVGKVAGLYAARFSPTPSPVMFLEPPDKNEDMLERRDYSESMEY